jgi:hypothetical protein
LEEKLYLFFGVDAWRRVDLARLRFAGHPYYCVEKGKRMKEKKGKRKNSVVPSLLRKEGEEIKQALNKDEIRTFTL